MYRSLAIIIVIWILLILLSTYNQIKYYMIDKTQYKLTDIKDIKFRTGDIIMHKWNANILTYDNINKKTNFNLCNLGDLFFQSGLLMNFSPKYYPYIHVSVIVVLDDIPYMYQLSQFIEYEYKYCRNINDCTKDVLDHPVLLNMDYVEYYRGHVHHFSYIGDEINEEKVKKIIEKNKDVQKSTISYLNTFLNKEYKNDKKHLCITFATKIIEEFGIHNFDNYYNSTQRSVFDDVVLNGNKYEKQPSIINNTYMNYHQ